MWSWDLTRLYTNLDSFIIQLTRKILPSKYRKDLQFLMRKKTIKSALRNGILLTKLFLPTERKNWSSDREKLEIRDWRLRICKLFEITRTIYSNSEGQNNFWWQNAFLTFSWRFLISNELEQLEFRLEKNVGIQKPTGKVRKFLKRDTT